MSPEVPIKFDPVALKDLKGLGRFRRRLLNQALRDELRTPDPSLPVERLPMQDWQALQIGDYRVIYRSQPATTGDKGPIHVVGRILDQEDFTESLREGRLTETLPNVVAPTGH